MTLTARLSGVVVRGDAGRVLLDVPELTLDSPRTAVIGPNGSGKSTLLRLLNGLSRPDAGSVELREEGRSPLDVVRHPEQARSVVGFVFSDPLAQLLMPTPLEDVALSLQRLPRGEAKATAAEWLDRFSVGHLAEQSVYELSSGERQRVALASVLAAGPSYLVLDEPTTLLDRHSVRRLEAFLGTLRIPHLLATHDLDVAGRYERVLWVDGGRVVRDGPGADVVAAYREHTDAMPL